jgi:ureidoacrylate peracid hydrolase
MIKAFFRGYPQTRLVSGLPLFFFMIEARSKLQPNWKSRNFEEILITGVLTNCCSETTDRDAFVRDYRVFFVSDAAATVYEGPHVASLMNLACGFAHILSTELLCRHIQGFGK